MDPRKGFSGLHTSFEFLWLFGFKMLNEAFFDIFKNMVSYKIPNILLSNIGY